MATIRSLSWRSPLLFGYLAVMTAVQLAESRGGLVRWSDYSVLTPLAAAALVPLRRTVVIGVATLAASVAVYGFAVPGVSDGGRAVVVAAAAVSLGLSPVICRTRLPRRPVVCPRAELSEVEAAADNMSAGLTHPIGADACDTASVPVVRTLGESLPKTSAIELAGYCASPQGSTGQASWLDAIPLPSARIALVAASATRNDGPAPDCAAELRATVRTLAKLDLQPEELLTHVGNALASRQPAGEVGEGHAGVLFSCLYMVYDPVSGHCTCARAGYPPPALVTPDGAITSLDLPAGPPLGLEPVPIEVHDVELEPGSVLLLHTHAPGPLESPLRVQRLPQGSPGVKSALEATCHVALEALLSGQRYSEAAVLAARTRTFDCGTVACWDLPSEPATVPQARKLVADKLDSWNMKEVIPTAQLIVSELVANAIRHAGPPIQARLIRTEAALICEVSDGSSTSPHLRRAATFDEDGRGLCIVAHLARHWGTRHDMAGKTVWVEHLITAGEGDRASL
ncbi:SpoIIE family protein phosphatase [Streptomyces sp. NPDC101149]|uniref:SpoIIE family protein phosphatase n=1 Tax=Streptomyces sp. NPDC101149 TaxID=3366113 RepID=UPI00380206FF